MSTGLNHDDIGITKDQIEGQPVIRMVCGPSSCGKSVYITKIRNRDDVILFPWMLEELQLEFGRSYVLHYNLFRPYSYAIRMRKLRRLMKNPINYMRVLSSLKSYRSFDVDPSLKKLVTFDATIKASVLVVPRAMLAKRISQRTVREVLVANQHNSYPRDKFTKIIDRINLAQLYISWIGFLEKNNISYELVQSIDEYYNRINSVQDMISLIKENGK